MTNSEQISEREARDESAAEVSIRIGARVALDAKLTSAGLLAVGALIAGILLSTAVIVFVAGLRGQRQA